MANVICSDEYCESTLNKEANLDKAIIIGGYVLFLVVLSALVLYGTSQGIYVDLTSLS